MRGGCAGAPGPASAATSIGRSDAGSMFGRSSIGTGWSAMPRASVIRGKMVTSPIGEGDERQPDRNLDENTDHGRERSAGLQSEEADRDGHRELEEVGRTDQRAGRGNVEGHAPRPGRSIGQRKDAVGLDQERHRDQRDQQRLLQDDLPLKPEARGMADHPVPIEDLPNIDPASLRPIDVAALAGPGAPAHPPRILMLYGSLRTRSYLRFASEEAARLLRWFGAETRAFNPSGLPLPDA